MKPTNKSRPNTTINQTQNNAGLILAKVIALAG